MSNKSKKQRAAANSAEVSTLSLNERILKECHDFYVDPKNGLGRISTGLKVDLLPPRKKITILLIGNHSAGKSSFINWYVEEHILKTGVAIETQGFTFVTSGKKRETLTGNATLHLYPHFKPLTEIPRLVDYITTEISTSKQKKFGLVTFIDTPGLVDGEMNYPFDVDRAIKFLGNIADMVFVFFDPIGQAMRKRTLNVVESLSETHGDKIKMFLSKADEAGSETDRQKVLMQIVQELCKRPNLNRQGLDLSTIYIPNPNKPVRCVNQIEDVCREVEKTINRTVQNTLNTLETDCNRIDSAIDRKMNRDDENKSKDFWSMFKGFCFLFGSIIVCFAFVAGALISAGPNKMLGTSFTDILQCYWTGLQFFWQSLFDVSPVYTGACLFVVVVISAIMSRLFKGEPTMSRKQKSALLERKEFLRNVVINRKRQLYEEYLQQSVAEHEL